MIRGVAPKHTVDVEVEGDDGPLTGAFTWRRRTVADNGAISAELSRLTGGTVIVDDGMRVLLSAQAELTVVTEKAPEWWRADQLDDSTLIAVYRRYMEWRDSFRRRPTVGPNGGHVESGAAGAGTTEPRRGLAPSVVGP